MAKNVVGDSSFKADKAEKANQKEKDMRADQVMPWMCVASDAQCHKEL